jgi:phosphate transport system permease protein
MTERGSDRVRHRPEHAHTPPPHIGGRTTSRFVRFYDRGAEFVITAGGLVVLAAMLGICLFLFNSAAPLLRGGDMEPVAAQESSFPPDRDPVLLSLEAGPGRVLALDGGARLTTIDVQDGSSSSGRPLVSQGAVVSAIAVDPGAGAVIGLDNGSAVVRTFGYVQRPLSRETEPERVASLLPGEQVALDDTERAQIESMLRLAPRTLGPDAYARRDADGVGRVWDLVLSDPRRFEIATGERITHIDARNFTQRRWPFAAILAGDRLAIGRARAGGGLGGVSGELRAEAAVIPLSPIVGDAPIGVFVTQGGDDTLVVWRGGAVQRYARDATREWMLAETTALPSESGEVRVARMALGARTLLLGDSIGIVHRIIVAPNPESRAGDGRSLRIANAVRLGDAAVTSIATQPRDRTVAVSLSDGTLAIVAPTPGAVLAKTELESQQTPTLLGLASDLDAIAVLSEDGRISVHEITAGHPDATPKSLFGRVWYEGYTEPQWVYQSTGAPGAEAKLSLIPLIFGTLKATLVAMIIAVPLGVLAAIYTSEFLHPNLRRAVKPAIELMASLPSVVLGFIAAVLIAPLVADALPAVLIAFGALPVAVLAGAHAWRFVPALVSRRLTTLAHLGLVTVVLAAGSALTVVAGPVVEDALFAPTTDEQAIMAGVYEPAPADAIPNEFKVRAAGAAGLSRSHASALREIGVFVRGTEFVRVPNIPTEQLAELVPAELADGSIRRWLDGEFGGAWPGWFLLMFAPGAIVAFLADRRAAPLWAALGSDGVSTTAAVVELARFMVRLLAMSALAASLASLATALGLDPRDSLFGPFSQRNTIVVGIAMGFAVIPIIYTISEDAMASVPGNLRAASLGSGATAWQTAVRVVLPVAASGIFSACMVGLGRAVGETMIVLMATGNTPEMSANIFSGFRTLAANIAVELPEAPRGGTHYRVLFLCGLALFAMTLVINTTAELVRQHVRKRNAAL